MRDCNEKPGPVTAPLGVHDFVITFLAVAGRTWNGKPDPAFSRGHALMFVFFMIGCKIQWVELVFTELFFLRI